MIRLCMALLFAVIFSTNAEASLLLKIGVDSRYAANPGAQNIPHDKAYEADVVLGNGYILVKTPDSTTIYDFTRRRRFVIDNETATYVNYSLYDILGFRILELANRKILEQAQVAIKLRQSPAAQENSEHILSVQDRPRVSIHKAHEGQEIVFSAAGEPLLRQSVQGTPVSTEDSIRFVKFLRHSFGGHPMILDSLTQAQQIPNQVIFIFRDFVSVHTLTVAVHAVRTIESIPYDLRSYAPRMLKTSEDGLDEILDRVGNAPMLPLADTIRTIKNDIAIAFREHRSLDVFLSAMELSLTTGEPFNAALSGDQLAMVGSDPVVQQLFSLLTPETKNGLLKAVRTLQDLRQHSQTKQYILKIFEANNRKTLGDVVMAKELFIEVLRTNALLASVYKDLGDALLIAYDTPRAWRCWDTGRRISPQLGNFAFVAKFEQSLAAEHPEYF